MQNLLIHRSSLPYILSVLVRLFSHVLSQVIIVEPLVGTSVPCVGGHFLH